MNFFVAKPSKILSWLNRKGYGGTLSDAFSSYLASGSILSRGTVYDNLSFRLQESGYSGNLDEKLNAMFAEKTGVPFRPDAERAFFDDDTLDMFTTIPSSGFTVVDDDSNTVIDDNSNIVKDDQ